MMLSGPAGTAFLILRDTPMTDADRPGDEFPPSRPGAKTLLAVLLVVAAGFAIAFWPQILAAMGIHVAPPPVGN